MAFGEAGFQTSGSILLHINVCKNKIDLPASKSVHQSFSRYKGLSWRESQHRFVRVNIQGGSKDGIVQISLAFSNAGQSEQDGSRWILETMATNQAGMAAHSSPHYQELFFEFLPFIGMTLVNSTTRGSPITEAWLHFVPQLTYGKKFLIIAECQK